ncbi:MAG: preprotein translocase subunit YajC [Bdellovibrionales bacterium]|nr:preprotein translocase subunit YajC [Bdellovibrionales bacterium]
MFQKFLQIFILQSSFFLLLSRLAFSNEEPTPKPNALEQFFPFILLAIFFYFLLIRPQQKKQKNQETFLSTLKEGEEVLTSSGIYGKIMNITSDFVILEIAPETQIRIAKAFISSYVQEKNPSKENNKGNKKIKRIKA